MCARKTTTFESESEQETESNGSDRLSTGIEVLDRKIDGGIPEGRIVALSAMPASQSELFLYKMAAVRDTVYLTTERRERDIESGFRDTETVLDGTEIHRLPPEDPFVTGRKAIRDLSDESLLVIDPINPLEEQDTRRYRSFLNEIKAATVETGGIALLHCLDGEETPEQRDRTEYLADIIFSLNTTLRGGSIENTLSVPKFRAGRSLPEAIDLDLTSDVTVDVSRKIA